MDRLNLKRFIANKINFPLATIEGQEAIHLIKVLRYKIGEKIAILDSQKNKLYKATIKEIKQNLTVSLSKSDKVKQLISQYQNKEEKKNNLQVIVEIETELPSFSSPKINISLAQGLLKGNKNDFTIQKTTELGIQEYIPLSLSRCIPKLDKLKKEEKRKRWQQIAISATKQCGRLDIPFINEVQSLNQLLTSAKNYDLILFPWEEEVNYNLKDCLQDFFKIFSLASSLPLKILIIIGPEGGMSVKEMLLVKESKGKVVSLGKRILKSETAAIFLVSILQYIFN